MRENICFYFTQTHVLFILSLVLLWFNTTTATSLGHKLVVATRGATNTCIDNERQALLDFNVRLPDPYDLLSIWRPEEEDDCCKWSGVTCSSQTGHVTTLELCRYITGGVGGEISLSFLNLTYLNHLDLSFCSFHGTTPPFIGSMTHLTYLDLSANEFIGTIPMFIGNMTQLISLALSFNLFTGSIPMSIGSLTSLTFLYLEKNQFVGDIPMSIGYLTNLTELELGDNNFSGTIPDSIGSMKKLTTIDISGNNFNGIIPRSIGSLTKLTSLTLSDNSLHGTIPPEFGNLTNLLYLSLRSLRSCTVENLDWLSSLSSLEDLFMDETSLTKANNWVNLIIGLQNLSDLSLNGCDLSKVMHPYSSVVNSSSSIDTLYLDNNDLNSSSYRWLCPLVGNRLKDFSVAGNSLDGKLSDFLNSLSRCTSPNMLEYLDASSNLLTGSLSDEIQNFSSLKALSLDVNQLNGTISDKLWQLPTLLQLGLSSNSLSGVISENIGKLNLLYVDLSWNSLEGVFFNDDVSKFSMSVKYIDLSSNKLGPRFPKSIQKMKKLRYLDLSNNSISDTIPTEYWNQWGPSQLKYLDLSFNNISGTLPELLSSPDLEKVDLSSNNFYGPMPNFPARISFLDLSKNKFQGEISFLCQIYENFEFLDLSRNSFTGQLPDSLKNLTYLRVLNLGHNTLSGYIPPYVGCLGQLETLCLYNNSFSGELPVSLENCTKLSLLDLGANKLIGNIPVWIGKNLSRLYALSLKANNFSGTIPSQICQLVSLQILDLSFNNLHGTIPSCVHNLTSNVQKGLFTRQNRHHYHSNFTLGKTYYSYGSGYIDSLVIEWQGKVNEFSSTLGLVKTIDLSNNNLKGKIPYELTNLHGLLVLDLSHNALVGDIPRDIGQMTELLTLNLSRNLFSGEIPSTMSQMDRLNDLDLSYNNLCGRVPSSTQLQSFPPERFTGNVGLCGLPTVKKCLGDEDQGVPHMGDSEGDAKSTDELQRWFYIRGATGFATGFWVSSSALLFNRRLGHAFF
ncbi:leucine-rich repeat-containing protein [Tanacetum coccineum]|uniref:Leucine-rich repeat-containing protein n=1 Tax=Tanacetum coccineum TaxID=301880 RepID=A0ABQ5ARZ7_9ASTR